MIKSDVSQKEEIIQMILSKIITIPEPTLRPDYWQGYEDALRSLKRQIEGKY